MLPVVFEIGPVKIYSFGLMLVTAFYFVASPYHNCLIDSDISHTECLKNTGW